MKKIVLLSALLLSMAKAGYVKDHKDAISRDMVRMSGQEISEFLSDVFKKRAERFERTQSRSTSPINPLSEKKSSSKASPTRTLSPVRESSSTSFQKDAVSEIKSLLIDFINDKKSTTDIKNFGMKLWENHKQWDGSEISDDYVLIRLFADTVGTAPEYYSNLKNAITKFLNISNEDMEFLKSDLKVDLIGHGYHNWAKDNNLTPDLNTPLS